MRESAALGGGPKVVKRDCAKVNEAAGGGGRAVQADREQERRRRKHLVPLSCIKIDFCGQTPKEFSSLPPLLSTGSPLVFVDIISEEEKATQFSQPVSDEKKEVAKEEPVLGEEKKPRKKKKVLKYGVVTDAQLSSFSGVSRKVFKYLCFKTTTITNSRSLSREDKLFLFLTKLKTNSSFNVIGAFFGVSESAASKFFRECLDVMYELSKENLFWLDKETVNARMPQSFKMLFKNVRAIIDCSEVEVERPSKLRQRVLSFSQYKGRHTIKFLVAVAPSGEIMFVSQAYGGRATDTEITANSGFLELVEEGDIIMGDKGFPTIEQNINAAGGVLLMPPFKSGERQFSVMQNREGYEIASVRVHVERAIERMKRFKILDFLTVRQLNYIDRILVIISFLCNLQPDLIRE